MFKRALRLYADIILVINFRPRSKLMVRLLPWLGLRLCYQAIIFSNDKQCFHIMFYFLIKNSYIYLRFASFFSLTICLCYYCNAVDSNRIIHHNVLSNMLYKTYFYTSRFFSTLHYLLFYV